MYDEIKAEMVALVETCPDISADGDGRAQKAFDTRPVPQPIDIREAEAELEALTSGP